MFLHWLPQNKQFLINNHSSMLGCTINSGHLHGLPPPIASSVEAHLRHFIHKQRLPCSLQLRSHHNEACRSPWRATPWSHCGDPRCIPSMTQAAGNACPIPQPLFLHGIYGSNIATLKEVVIPHGWFSDWRSDCIEPVIYQSCHFLEFHHGAWS